MGIERRVSERTDVKFKINYIHEGDFLISNSKDISVSGMFIYTENPPSVGETVTLAFSLEDTEQLKVNAKVVWINNSKNEKDKGIGVKFIEFDSQVKEMILKIVKRVAIIDAIKWYFIYKPFTYKVYIHRMLITFYYLNNFIISPAC